MEWTTLLFFPDKYFWGAFHEKPFSPAIMIVEAKKASNKAQQC